MSGIYIPGMEMPVFEHQSWDIRRGADGKWYVVDTNAETSDGVWHEIIPVLDYDDLIDKSGVDVMSWTDGEYGTDEVPTDKEG